MTVTIGIDPGVDQRCHELRAEIERLQHRVTVLEQALNVAANALRGTAPTIVLDTLRKLTNS